MGHAGSDIESQYKTTSEIESNEACDPLLTTAAYLLHYGILTTSEIIDYYFEIKSALQEQAKICIDTPKLTSKELIMESLISNDKSTPPMPLPSIDQRKTLFGSKYKQLDLKRTLQQNINFALTSSLIESEILAAA